MKYMWSIGKKMLYISFYSIPFFGYPQYTEVINSNRPGESQSAFSVGKNVIQAEMGITHEQNQHFIKNTDSKLLGVDFALRYGLFFEQLELFVEGAYFNDKTVFQNPIPEVTETKTDFTKLIAGAKFLIYDPFKNPDKNKPNLYSWKANNSFRWRNLIPAISLYAGAHFTLSDNAFFPKDPMVSPKVMLASQSHITPSWVMVFNLGYDKIGSDFPEWNYILTITHALRNPKWSLFTEYQGVSSERYKDALIRAGTAYLWSKDMQLDLSIGTNFKDTPSKIFGSIGISYRLDYHKDSFTVKGKSNEKAIRKAQRKNKRKNKRRKKKDF
ncbi:MAG: transporter [Flavobacteriaceae bacterium]|nr:transporter [Flavobacteriaceae bacterium]